MCSVPIREVPVLDKSKYSNYSVNLKNPHHNLVINFNELDKVSVRVNYP